MEWLISFLLQVAFGQGAFRLLKYIGISSLARFMLRRHGIFSFPGFEFFTDRPALDKRHRLYERLISAKEIHALWITGETAFADGRELNKIKRLILPNPDSKSFGFFEENLPDKRPLGEQLIETIVAALNRAIEIKLCPEFIGYSLMIGDPEEIGAWIHIELVMPFANRNDRPSFTIYKSQNEQLFLRFKGVYEKIWNKSMPPPEMLRGK